MTHIAIGMSYIKLLAEILNHYVLSFQAFFQQLGVFGTCFQTTIFSFEIILHILSRIFSPIHISTYVFKQQFLVFKCINQTPPNNKN